MSRRSRQKEGRSGTRQCPICGQQVPLVEHHIHGRDVPRWQQEWNIARVCATCHDCIHRGDVIIEKWAKVNGLRTLIWRQAYEAPKLAEGAQAPQYGEN